MPSNIQLFRKYNNNKVFIETGSFMGDGIKDAIFSGYDDIYSIELAEKYYHLCKTYFTYHKNVHITLGDSVAELPSILNKINQPCTFWLDAHYSGGDTDFANVLTPLMKELDIIKQHPIKTHTIMIDDLREWQRDYPGIRFNIEDLKNKILEINPNYQFIIEDGHVASDILVADVRRFKPVNIIVFSKDRAMQLDLFIRTFNNYVRDSSTYRIDVLYTYSNDRFRQGYERLAKNIPDNVYLWKEEDFKLDVLGLIDQSSRHTVFFVDDDLFKESFNFYDRQMELFDWDGTIACRSLRLSYHLEYCYTMQIPMRQPKFFGENKFNWEKEVGDFGYPMSLDGHIFRTNEIYQCLQELEYTNPNTLESVLVGKRFNFGRNMICYYKSPIMNNPINRVQTVNGNICGNIGAEYLNEQFLKDYIIDMTPFAGFMNKSCHQEVTPILISR